MLDVEVREPGTTHATSLQKVERWLAGATTNPNEASKKAKLKMMLMQRSLFCVAGCGSSTSPTTPSPAVPTFHVDVTDPLGDAVRSDR